MGGQEMSKTKKIRGTLLEQESAALFGKLEDYFQSQLCIEWFTCADAGCAVGCANGFVDTAATAIRAVAVAG